MPRRKDEPGFSRRSFLKTVGAGGVAAGVLSQTSNVDAQAANVHGPGAVPISLNVNGQMVRLQVEPRVTLLDALRTRVTPPLTGAKRVCDRGACGACTMIADGKTIYACSTLAIEAQGRRIRTVESFTQGTVLHPVQQAFCDKDGLMCGFCTPGFVTSAVALLERTPKPTVEQARRALDGNICRCGTYVRVLEATLNPGTGGTRG
ncbi:MAG TPA: (2Fe-2S)-binding protein [Vicinamibacterales bacterium]|nr:(2Fe-2S)-binding protein [Vicinamibacterales bacterium]